MKTILVPTDFSAAANNAAQYAWHVACALSANIKLCHAFKIPVEAYMAGTVAWPLEDYDTLKSEIETDLKQFAEKLEKQHQTTPAPHQRKPNVAVITAAGEAVDITRTLAADADCPLVVMGMSGAGGLERFLFGSTSKKMIDVADFPLLLIPKNSFYHGIKKIAFATDLKSADIQVICSLASFAKHFNAEILICHISDDKFEPGERQMQIDTFMSQVTDKINYNNIYYRHIKAIDVPHGLNWICEHGMVDMLAMSHGQHNITDSLLGYGSFTQKLAKHINIPLLVYPKEIQSAALVVF